VQQRRRCAQRAGDLRRNIDIGEGVIIAATGDQDAPDRPHWPMDAQHRWFQPLSDRLAVRAGEQTTKRLVQPPQNHQIVELGARGRQDRRLRVAGQRAKCNRHMIGDAQAGSRIIEQWPTLSATAGD
jgi:hypothetical protein